MKYQEFINQLFLEGYHRSHTSYARGYVSRKDNTYIKENYKGRFGEGYKVYTACYCSTSYCYVSYYVK